MPRAGADFGQAGPDRAAEEVGEEIPDPANGASTQRCDPYFELPWIAN